MAWESNLMNCSYLQQWVGRVRNCWVLSQCNFITYLHSAEVNEIYQSGLEWIEYKICVSNIKISIEGVQHWTYQLGYLALMGKAVLE